ncbi:hypothetical protein EDB84DRAFT_1531457, partial [Lactarius hengduanensis]
ASELTAILILILIYKSFQWSSKSAFKPRLRTRICPRNREACRSHGLYCCTIPLPGLYRSLLSNAYFTYPWRAKSRA